LNRWKAYALASDEHRKEVVQELKQRNAELETAKQEAAVAKNNLEIVWKPIQKVQLVNA
jgi:hypothetical protein